VALVLLRAVVLSLAILLVPSIVQAGTVPSACHSEQQAPTVATVDLAP
jgi:hypothetical protein